MKWIKSTSAAVLTLMAGSIFASANAEEVNIYSYRQSFLIEPILSKFTEQTGIKTNVVFAKKGLVEKLKKEGQYSPADVLLSSDFSRLMEMTSAGLSQPVNSDVLNKNIPSQFRDVDQHWYALTKRVRNVYASKERMGELTGISYEALAAPEYKGKICMRSSKHPYNIALIASMIAHHGEAQTKTWLEGLKANLARKPQGNDRAQVRAVKEGECDLALGNSYYFGVMQSIPEQKVWADAVNILFPNQGDRGAHVNVSGIAMTKYAPNKDAAVKLMEFLSSEVAQQSYASVNMEYPVNPQVKPSEIVASWGEFKEDTIALSEISKHRKTAIKLLDQLKFDL
ncbi:Fe(3+) ABC transporter substrate-binding protein [Thalassotalea sp. Y01]|uniref:Fe(3+) ABC transporter substrate-binding protein n=1 Tax=Thalassotalea sp. Y01 TaxID=2729613 RepID=UPI00145E197F|nr:Fe(3+) ABC transporter substrate-binding protein [Thalassotalea sp. Y01]NMP15206.1 Fe(3+) ABC transporter substrate-binding protein [Thalassotalea sp. Y01]